MFRDAAGVAGETRQVRVRIVAGRRRKSFCLLGNIPNAAGKLSSRRRGRGGGGNAHTRADSVVSSEANVYLSLDGGAAATNDERNTAAAAVGAPI